MIVGSTEDPTVAMGWNLNVLFELLRSEELMWLAGSTCDVGTGLQFTSDRSMGRLQLQKLQLESNFSNQ